MAYVQEKWKMNWDGLSTSINNWFNLIWALPQGSGFPLYLLLWQKDAAAILNAKQEVINY
jgi:hypothetical protein